MPKLRLVSLSIPALLISLLISSANVMALDEDAQVSKDEGMRLYGIHHSEAAIPLLEQAAGAGDVEAMYYLGEANRRLVMGNMNRAALDWYYQAAQHGDPYAMLRLNSGGACKLGDVCPDNGDDWREAALEETLPKAEDGDTDAMMALYSIYATLEDMDAAQYWLLESAEGDNIYAQDWLGRRALGNHEEYENDTKRREAAEVWFRRAAELGYGPSMNNLSSVLTQLGNEEEAYEWMIGASDAGVVDARMGIAWCYLEPEFDVICLNEQNMAIGVGVLEAMVEEINKSEAEYLLDTVAEPLNDEEREEANEVKAKWLNHEPPLSYFPEKYGF